MTPNALPINRHETPAALAASIASSSSASSAARSSLIWRSRCSGSVSRSASNREGGGFVSGWRRLAARFCARSRSLASLRPSGEFVHDLRPSRLRLDALPTLRELSEVSALRDAIRAVLPRGGFRGCSEAPAELHRRTRPHPLWTPVKGSLNDARPLAGQTLDGLSGCGAGRLRPAGAEGHHHGPRRHQVPAGGSSIVGG